MLFFATGLSTALLFSIANTLLEFWGRVCENYDLWCLHLFLEFLSKWLFFQSTRSLIPSLKSSYAYYVEGKLKMGRPFSAQFMEWNIVHKIDKKFLVATRAHDFKNINLHSSIALVLHKYKGWHFQKMHVATQDPCWRGWKTEQVLINFKECPISVHSMPKGI